MKPISVLELSVSEQGVVAAILKSYFPELGTDEEMNGADVVQNLSELYSSLPQIELEEA